MARYAYDVNTAVRNIDVHKQFNGGLKTVDTDDALGAVFLRQAENVSLSEFGFIEKRYGTYQIDKMFEGYSGNLQGFWEYYDEDEVVREIAIFGGRLYIRTKGDENFTEMTTFRKEGDFEYDDSFIGTGQPISDYITFTFTQNASYNPSTGAYRTFSSTTNRHATNKLKIADLDGFNNLNKLKLNTNDFSYISFWDENDNYLGYYGSPLAEEYEYEEGVDPVDLSEFKLGRKPIANELFVIPTEASYIAFNVDNTTFEYNEETRYVWGQEALTTFNNFELLTLTDTVGGTVYPFSVDYYPFQTEKEISGVLIKDYLYLFTGTYPLYYKGGTNFYFYPMYRPTSNDIINGGHNFFETRNFEEVYGFSGDLYKLKDEDNFVDPSLDFEIVPEDSFDVAITPRISFTKQEYYPKLPFAVRGQKNGELTFELNYNYSKETTKIFDPYLYGTEIAQAVGGKSDTYTDTNYAVKLDSISYSNSNAASANEFIKINPEKVTGTSYLSNYTQELAEENLNYNQYRVRDDFGLFNRLVTENQLDKIPSPTHEQDDPANPVLQTDSTKRGFLGGERKHPYGVDQIWVATNFRDISFSIEERIQLTPETGNLKGEKFGIRWKVETSREADGVTPVYEPLNWKGFIRTPGASPLATDEEADRYLQDRFVVVIKPVVEGFITEQKEYWRLLFHSQDCYFQDGILYFIMPEFPDRIDGRAITEYAVDIKTVDKNYLTDNAGRPSLTKMQDYIDSYDGKAHRAIGVTGKLNFTNDDDWDYALRDFWETLDPGRTKFDYNMFTSVSPQSSPEGLGFGEVFTATITELIPGSYDFKMTFAVEETRIPVILPQDRDEFTGGWSSLTIYEKDDIVRYSSRYYRSLSETPYQNGVIPSADSNWEEVDFETYFNAQDISTDTDYINIYFRGIQIYDTKITDYLDIKEDNVSPILSATRAIEHYGKILLFNSEESKESVFVSFPGNFNYFPSLFRLEFFTPSRQQVQAITPFMDVLVVQTDTQTWGIKGTTPLVNAPNPYSVFTISSAYGAIAWKSVRIVRNQLMFLSHLGLVSIASLYAIDGQYNVKHQDTMIKNIVYKDPDAVATHFDDQYWLNFPNYGITLRWYVDKKAFVLDKYPWSDFKGVFSYLNSTGTLEFITHKSQTFDTENAGIYRIGVDKELPSDLGQPFSSIIETSFLNQNYPFHPKNYKEFKFDFTLQNEYNLSKTSLFQTQDFALEQNVTKTIVTDNPFRRNHYYQISFLNEVPLEAVFIGEYEVENLTPITTTIVVDDVETDIVVDYQFSLPNYLPDISEMTLTFSETTTYRDAFVVKDNTYDENITFLSKVLTEDNYVLNREINVGYDDELAEIPIDYEDFRDFTLGTSTFGNRVTLVKTIKLSGRGYNSKLYFQDFSKSKWTIESMGITYKMKRARSR